MQINQHQITRVEIIGKNGRECVKYGAFSFSVQDDGKTLKIFVDKEVREHPYDKKWFIYKK